MYVSEDQILHLFRFADLNQNDAKTLINGMNERSMQKLTYSISFIRTGLFSFTEVLAACAMAMAIRPS